MDQIWKTIINTSFTLKDLKNRLRSLRFFLTEKRFSDPQKKVTNINDSDFAWINSLGENFIAQFNSKNIYQILDQLETNINKLTPLIIYLPFELPQAEKEDLGKWVRNNFKLPDLILDVKYDPGLIAGCSLVWKGVYRDYSLKQRMEDSKEQIINSLKSYLK